jgi:molybdopterin synthase sulfur carrier subunit
MIGESFRPKASRFDTAQRYNAVRAELRGNEMPVKVMIPTPLRPYAGKRASAEFQAKTVGEALGHLTSEFAELRKHLFTEEGKLRSFVNVYVNDEDIRYLAKENTPTKDGDTISIITSIAGGCISRRLNDRRTPA